MSDHAVPAPDPALPAPTLTGHVPLDGAAGTRAFGAALAALLRRGDVLILTGDLGAGKTTFTQGLASGLDVQGQVASPTFVIAREHRPRAQGPGLVHVDAYRLVSLDEVDALDLDTSLDTAVTVVEWGEGKVEALATDRLEITLERPGARAGGTIADLDLEELAREAPREVWARGVGERWDEAALEELARAWRP